LELRETLRLEVPDEMKGMIAEAGTKDIGKSSEP